MVKKNTYFNQTIQIICKFHRGTECWQSALFQKKKKKIDLFWLLNKIPFEMARSLVVRNNSVGPLPFCLTSNGKKKKRRL